VVLRRLLLLEMMVCAPPLTRREILEISLKTHSDENNVFLGVNMFLWHFSDVRGHILRKISSKLYF
jgi:hypothetical protein